MKIPTRLLPSAPPGLVLALSLALLCGCREPAGPDEHAGHDHAGHDHSAQPHPASSGPASQGHGAPSPHASLSGAKCAAHGAPKEWCFICDPSLRDRGRLWCQEHGRYEDRCFECHPEVEDKRRAWCAWHALYDDECFLCHPGLKDPALKQAAAAPDLFCSEHGVREAECAVCQPAQAAGLQPGESLKVRLPSSQSVALAGIETSAPVTGPIEDSIECMAELSYDQNRLAQIAAPVNGVLQSVDADLGVRVEERQTVARIWSASIAEAVAKAVLSHQTLERERKLHAQRISPQADLQAAEANHVAACQFLRTLGFTEKQIDELSRKPQDQVLMEVRAPFAGEIVERTAVRGSLVETGKSLFTVADRSTMWAMLQVPESALDRVQVGQSVELRLEFLPARIFKGKLTWIGPAVDERTRLTRARAEFANPDGLLRDKMFATARILTRQAESALLIPAGSVQLVDGRPFVFVRLEPDLFALRAISLGTRNGDRREILAGLQPREEIAVRHVFALKSAMLMSRLGAGCCQD